MSKYLIVSSFLAASFATGCGMSSGTSPWGPAFAGGAPAAGSEAHDDDLDPSAVCEAIITSDVRLECIQAASTRVYTAAELEACKGLMLGEQKLECMQTSGQAATSDAPPPEPAEPEVATIPTEPMQTIKFGNHNQSAVTRVAWRPVTGGRFRDVKLMRPIEGDRRQFDLEIGAGTVDFCFELASGQRVFVPAFKNDFGYFLVPPDETRAQAGTCTDTL